jgi:hypothetical protein
MLALNDASSRLTNKYLLIPGGSDCFVRKQTHLKGNLRISVILPNRTEEWTLIGQMGLIGGVIGLIMVANSLFSWK